MTASLPRPMLRRAAYAALAAGLVACTVLEAISHGAGWPAVAGALAPDLTLLAGGGKGLARGQLHPRAVPAYNAVHRFWGPVALMVVAALALPAGWFVAGLAWASHVAVDRAVGYGLRDAQGFQRAR